MSLIEIEKRIDFIGNLKKEKRKTEMKDMFSILHFTIKSGTAQFRKKSQIMANNKSFYNTLDKCLNLNDKNIDSNNIDDVSELMEAANVKIKK